MEQRLRGRIAGSISILTLLFLFLPLAVVVLFSFHETASLSFPFTGFSLRWFRSVLESAEFREALRNSLTVAIPVALLTLLLGTLAAYGLSRTASRVKAPLAVLFFLPITLPGLFLGLALLVFFSRLRVPLSLVSVGAGHLVFVFPYFYLLVRAALDRLDPLLEEAASDLGASRWDTFRRVTLPQVWPVLVAATSLAFALSFDEFVITFFVIGNESTLPMFIWSGVRRTIDPSINTVSTMLMGTTLTFFAVAFAFTVRGSRRRGMVLPESITETAQRP